MYQQYVIAYMDIFLRCQNVNALIVSANANILILISVSRCPNLYYLILSQSVNKYVSK